MTPYTILVRLMLLVIFLNAGQAVAAVIFAESFDLKDDWAPACLQCGRNANGYNGGGETAGTPKGWDFWRNEELWNPLVGASAIPGSHPTMEVSGAQYSGPSGKSFQVWNESNVGRSGDGWGADGQLAKNLGGNYREIFVSARIKFSPSYQFKYDSNNAAQIKLFRICHTDNFDAPFLNFSGGNNAPIALMKIHYKQFGGFGYDFQHRCDPQLTNYDCSVPYDRQASSYGGKGSFYGSPTFASWSAGGGNKDGWHVLSWQVRLNTKVGAADGVIRFWQNGVLLYERTDIKWVDKGGDINAGWNMISLGGNAFNVFDAKPSSRAEQWYAIDNVVVSTDYKGPPPVPLGLEVSDATESSIRLAWSQGANGATCSTSGYKIYYGTAANALVNEVDVGQVTSYNLTSLSPDTKYYFAVSAYNSDGLGTNYSILSNPPVKGVTKDAVPSK